MGWNLKFDVTKQGEVGKHPLRKVKVINFSHSTQRSNVFLELFVYPYLFTSDALENVTIKILLQKINKHLFTTVTNNFFFEVHVQFSCDCVIFILLTKCLT